MRQKLPVIAAILAGVIALSSGVALATRTAGDRFADATFDKLGGDPDRVLSTIAGEVVEKLTEDGGTLDGAQQALIDRITALAGDKLDGVEVGSLLDGVKGEVVEAGLGKLDGIDVDRIIDQVTAALIAQASAEIEGIDLQELARSVLTDVAADVDIEGMVADELAKVDVEELVLKAVTGSGGSSSGTSGGSANWLGFLFGKD